MDGSSQDHRARCFEKALAQREASMDGPAEEIVNQERLTIG
jgi:hypothetical protein